MLLTSSHCVCVQWHHRVQSQSLFSAVLLCADYFISVTLSSDCFSKMKILSCPLTILSTEPVSVHWGCVGLKWHFFVMLLRTTNLAVKSIKCNWFYVVIRNFLATLKLFPNVKCSLSLRSKLPNWFVGNGSLTPICSLSNCSLSQSLTVQTF